MDTRLERARLNWTRSANSHTGRRHVTAAAEAGHMSAPDHAPCSSKKILLAPLGASTHVHDHQIARVERRRERLLDLGFERLAIDWAIEQPRRFNPLAAKRRDKGHGFPMAVGNAGHKPFAPRRPAAERLHIGFRPGFIDEHQTLGLDLVLTLLPLRPPSRDVGPFAFARHDAFF